MTTSLERLRARAAELLERVDRAPTSEDSEARLAEETALLQTELALQQDELTESHRRLDALHVHYQRLFERAPIGFVRLSSTFVIQDINVAARQLLGVDTSWRQLALVFTAFLPAASLVSFSELTRGDGGAARIAITSARGEALADVRTVPWTGNELGWLVVLDDVTELSEARARQHEAEERLSQVVYRMSDGLVVVDATTGLVHEHNEAFAALVGRPGEVLAGHSHDAFFVPALRAVQTVALRQCLKEGRRPARISYVGQKGDVRVTEVTVGALKEQGRPLEFFVVRDVTQQLRAEEEHRQVESRLAETQKLEALGLLAAGVAHDMNNLLMAVLAATELPPSAESLADLRAAALRGRELTERLLAVSRRRPLREEPFDLLAVAAEVVSLARRTFRREIEVTFTRPPGTWIVQGDPGQWHQALLNLVINARDAVTTRGHIDVVAEIKDGAHTLEVRDDGVGMTTEVQRRAFEPFFTTKGEGSGTGLGLSHVRAIVSSHGGTIALASAPGKGTIVRLGVRALEGNTSQLKRLSVLPSSPPKERQSVLAVDDEPFVLRATMRLLERQGYDVTLATSAEEAMKLVEAKTFDLVVTDLSMPRITGDHLARAVRCRAPSTPVVVMTGLAEDKDVDALRAMGVSAVLNKPFRLDEIEGLLASLEPPQPPPAEMDWCGALSTSCSRAESCPFRRAER